jgi:hypothetical protein
MQQITEKAYILILRSLSNRENMKVDLCTWTKNGAKTLIPVLKTIEHVILREEVADKIAVDDSSIDNTVAILKEFNWKVYPNRKGFINGGTTEAFSHVQSEFFVSVEQDVLLGGNWWNIVSKHMEDSAVAVAQGIEMSTNRAERGIQNLVLKGLRQVRLEERSKAWKSIGNNIYRSKIVKALGFVDDPVSMSSFHDRITSRGFKWITDINAVSTHIHGNLLNTIHHYVTFYGLMQQSTYLDNMRAPRYVAGLAFSPLKGFKLAVEAKEPMVQPFYVLRYLALTPTFFERRKRRLS